MTNVKYIAGSYEHLNTRQQRQQSLPEEHDVLPQLVHRAQPLHSSLGVSAGEGVDDAQLP